MIIYLVTIAAFYFAVGLVLVSGARIAIDAIGPALASDPGRYVQLGLGVVLVIVTIIGIALLAGLVEVASMLPYLAAVGIIVAAGLSWTQQLTALAAYVLIMIVPALALLAVRRAAGARIEPWLQRIEARIAKASGGAASWVVGIIGVLIALDAAAGLFG